MGILNVTPDSFSDGGRYVKVDAALRQAERLAQEGADILDIGGESTRPGARSVPPEEELRRVLPVVRAVHRVLPELPLSIDTYKASVAQAALAAGAELVNDVSALRFDVQMAEVVAASGAGVVLMHMRGTPQTMQSQLIHYDDVMSEIGDFLRERLIFAESRGIVRARIILDPGIGFGKRPQDNSEILRRLGELAKLGRPILLGTSRKSFLGAITHRPVSQRLEETIASCLIGALHGAQILRVHDVGSVRRALQVLAAVQGEQ